MSLFLEYIWLDSSFNLRSKTKVMFLKKDVNSFQDLKIEMIPQWNYDGSSTGQAEGNYSEIILQPMVLYQNPFRKTKGAIVLCETFTPNNKPTKENTRRNAVHIFEKYKNLNPLFGLEQEFFFYKNNQPNYFTIHDNPESQGDYYCGVGGKNIVSIERQCAEECLLNAVFAGIQVTGMNVEVAPSQWEIQLCSNSIKAADQLILLRYIINRTAEKYGLYMNIDPKPIQGDWNGSGCHVNFSTEQMRQKNGYSYILDAIHKLKETHLSDIEQYGVGNKERLSGNHETSSWETFSHGVADRSASIRIPNNTFLNKCGYFEDRRPSSNMDPYVVTSLLLLNTQQETKYKIEKNEKN